MEMIQNGIAEGLPETIRRDQREKGVPVIGREQPTKEIDTVNMPNFLDIAVEKSGELSRIYVRIPAYCRQFFIHLSNFDTLVQSRHTGENRCPVFCNTLKYLDSGFHRNDES